jgi:hypothetical protein
MYLPFRRACVIPRFLTCLSGLRVVHVVKYHVFTFLVLCCAVRQDFSV